MKILHGIGLCLMLTFLISNIHGSRILGLFIHPGYSHFNFFHPIMRGLAENGHSVMVVSYFSDKNPLPNYKEILLTPKEHNEILLNSVNLTNLDFNVGRRIYDLYEEFFSLAHCGSVSCETALDSIAIDKVLELHKTNKFDLIITEFFDTDCMLGIAYKMNVPFIGLSSCALMPWHYDRLSLDDNPSYIPSEFVGFSEKMNFKERIINWIITKSTKLMYRIIVGRSDNHLLEKKFGKIPDVQEIAKNTSLILVNQHYSLSLPKPLPPSVIEVGGIHLKTQRVLPKDIKEILDSAKNGVIYISWGSMIRSDSLPEPKRESILKALGKLPQRILWKWENDTLLNKPDNVFIKKWVPQNDVLCHPNVKVFLSHGGMMGMIEATACGIPMVVTPIYGDQFLNAAAIEYRNIGVILKYEDITEENVFESINKVLDSDISKKAQQVSYSFKNRIVSPLETAIWWIEHVINTNGAKLTKSHSVNINWFQFHSFDVILLLITGILIFLFIFIKIIILIFNKKTIKKVKKQ